MRLYLLVLLLLFSNLCAQESLTIENDYNNHNSDWRIIISPYLLIPGMATDVGGEKIRQSFNDISSMANFGMKLNTIFMYKKFILTADGTYGNLGASQKVGPVTAELEMKKYILDLKLGYLVHSTLDFSEKNVIKGWALEANAGAKYWKRDLAVDYVIEPPLGKIIEGSIEEPNAWWDLMVGARFRIFISKSVLLGISGNIGGFGVGNSSNLSWDFSYVNTFKVSNLISITAGYKTFRYSREDGEGDQKLETTVHVFGPLLGISFVF